MGSSISKCRKRHQVEESLTQNGISKVSGDGTGAQTGSAQEGQVNNAYRDTAQSSAPPGMCLQLTPRCVMEIIRIWRVLPLVGRNRFCGRQQMLNQPPPLYNWVTAQEAPPILARRQINNSLTPRPKCLVYIFSRPAWRAQTRQILCNLGKCHLNSPAELKLCCSYFLKT